MFVAMLEGQILILQVKLALKLDRGSYISEMLRDRFKGTSRMTIYRVIDKLKTTGLIASELQDNGESGGIKREYHLTPAGDEVANNLLVIENTLKASKRKAKKHQREDIDY